MGVYIKGMEMPKNCDDCRLGIDCAYDESQDGYKMLGGRPHNCPLVPAPQHGRLIDADAFADEMKERQTAAIKWMRESVRDHDAFIRAEATVAFLSEVKLTLDKMPTVIPASEESE